ncbi:acylphosphatase [Pollutimonas sp. H1-120]|uniref:acylphosphatase n=1 Tax=Pollutimonas sp. H1-120 TaxID=3148824 RepID=UPI003B526E4B
MKKLYNDSQAETISVNITGRVQGVGFRAATVRQAHLLGVRGWVRNLEDGSVEALLQGPHDRVDRMLSWLHVGPPGARVGEVNHRETFTERYFERFEQI